jgi:hypothetical protein
MEESIFVNDGL